MPPDLIRGWKPVRVKKTRQIKNLEPRFDAIETEKALALRFAARAATPSHHFDGGPAPQIRDPMRAEVERLVEEIKQSVGLLRRHL
jgi:hypothetical protein